MKDPGERPHPPALPQPLTLPALQVYVKQIVVVRNFTTDMNEIFILLTEELGELATEFKHRAYTEHYTSDNLSLELADVLLYLLDLANGFGVDLMSLWPEHERDNDRRWAPRRAEEILPRKVRADMTLNGLCRHVEDKARERRFEDSTEMLLILLTEEIGELARELRLAWKGLADPPRAGRELLDALHYLFRLSNRFGVDLEKAVTAKEQANAARVWRF